MAGEPVDEPPEVRFQLGQPALFPAEPDQHDHVVDADHRVMGPPSQGQRLCGQPVGLVEVATQQLLAGPEQRGVPGEVELSQLPGGLVVALQAALEGWAVALLELVGQQEPTAFERHHLVAVGLGEPDHLGGGAHHLLTAVISALMTLSGLLQRLS